MKTESDSLVMSDRERALRAILTDRPDVITDLEHTVLPKFVSAVNLRFQEQLTNNRPRYTEDCARAPHLCGDLDNFIVLQELRPRFDAPIPTRVINPVREAFPGFKDLLDDAETRELCEALVSWSKRAGLDEDWFRDHGLAVMRHYIADWDLPWVKVSPSIQRYVMQRSWLGALIWDFSLAEYLEQLKISTN